jgi:hypothetical protein
MTIILIMVITGPIIIIVGVIMDGSINLITLIIPNLPQEETVISDQTEIAGIFIPLATTMNGG